MATEFQKYIWERYLRRYRKLFNEGVKQGLIHTYEKKLIENLRHVYWGGLPASIILLTNKACNGFCFDRALLCACGFEEKDDFKLVYADIDGIKLNPEEIDKVKDWKDKSNWAVHCFAERTMEDGTTWVYDTSTGLVYEKELYYKMENPKIRHVNDKEKTLKSYTYQEIMNADIEIEHQTTPFLMPFYDAQAKYGDNPLYKGTLLREIKIVKEEIAYDKLCQDLREEMILRGFENTAKTIG